MAPQYEGEDLCLVGYCNRWKHKGGQLRFQRVRAGSGHQGTCVSATDGLIRHQIMVRLKEGCLSFQVVSCSRGFSFKVHPVEPGDDGFFRLVGGDPSALAATVGGHGHGHGRNFFIDEAAGTALSIYVELFTFASQRPLAEGLAHAEDAPAATKPQLDAAVWYEVEDQSLRCLPSLPTLSQARDQQKPKFAHTKKDPQEFWNALVSEWRSASLGGGGGAAAMGGLGDSTLGGEEVVIVHDAEGKREFEGLVFQARSLSRRSFDSRFYIRELGNGKHLSLLVRRQELKVLGYVLYIHADMRYLWIEHLAVHERFRRKGLGTRLIRWMVSTACGWCIPALRLSAVSDAVTFYSALGFRIIPAASGTGVPMELQVQKVMGSPQGSTATSEHP